MAVTPRPYHHGNLRAALLESAERTLDEGGDLSLRELARQVGVSHAAPRRHFADKQALLDALAEDGFERLGGELRERDGGGRRASTRACSPSRAPTSRFATEHAALLELMFAGKHRPGAAASLREAADRAFEAPLALILEGQARGEVVPGDPERVALVAWATLQGLATMINSRCSRPPRSTTSSRSRSSRSARPAPPLGERRARAAAGLAPRAGATAYEPAQAGTPVASARVIRTDDSIFEPRRPRKTPLIGGMSS